MERQSYATVYKLGEETCHTVGMYEGEDTYIDYEMDVNNVPVAQRDAVQKMLGELEKPAEQELEPSDDK